MRLPPRRSRWRRLDRDRRFAPPSGGATPGEHGRDTGPRARALIRGIAPVLHDLRVHQIELEMQNEDLRRTQAELEASRARYFDLYDLAPVGYFTLSEQGLILEANFTAATLLGWPRGALVRRPLTRFIVRDDQDIYYLHRKRLFATGAPQVMELRLRERTARSSGHASRRRRRGMLTAQRKCAEPS